MKLVERTKWLEATQDDARLRPITTLVGLALIRHRNGRTGHCFPSVARLAVMAKVSVRTARNSLRELEACGYIATKPVLSTSSSYEFFMPQGVAVGAARRAGGAAPHAGGAAPRADKLTEANSLKEPLHTPRQSRGGVFDINEGIEDRTTSSTAFQAFTDEGLRNGKSLPDLRRVLHIESDAGFVREIEKYLRSDRALDDEAVGAVYERLEDLAEDYLEGGVAGWARRILDELEMAA